MTATDADATLDWEAELASLLGDLADVQQDLLTALATKRKQLAAADLAGVAETQQREEQLARRLRQCQSRRSDLVVMARKAVIAGETASVLRLLRHESLANWVPAQRALLHVSQLMGIIAIGGPAQAAGGVREPVDSVPAP